MGSREFHDPVRDVRGGQGIWYVKDPRISAEISAALLHATCRDFPAPLLGAATDEPCMC